ncbi:MAG: trypsin-like peptidase domain-containing protein [Candidatus Rokubacteria bacterium]|nr:trypsin-like peptidase domain-containing protein [Candidatus Rokubacteria bacterium]
MTPHTARAGLLAAGLLLSLAAGFGIHAFWTTRVIAPSSQAPSPLTTADSLQSAFVQVAERVRPAVVNLGTVQMSRTARRPAVPGPFADDPVFKDFFDQFFGRRGQGPSEEFRQSGLGSGVIFDKRGYVLTNFHVIRGADAVTVRLSTRQELRGRIVGTDPKTDLAVIQFQPEGPITVATLGDSDAVRVGEWAIAIGNPFGLDQTVTVGVVSATARADVGIATYENFIQTDASINPGNSGGPLVNLRGEVIGINTAIVAAGQGIGFAIPANMVKRVTGHLVDRGKVMRGWLGVSVQPLSRELADSLGVTDTRGAVVARIYPDSPAAKAGLTQNDVIVGFDGSPVEDYHHLQRLSADAEVGKTVKIDYVRKRERKTAELKIAEAPDSASPK